MKTSTKRKTLIVSATVTSLILIIGGFAYRYPASSGMVWLRGTAMEAAKIVGIDMGNMNMKGMKMEGMKMEPGSVMLTSAKEKLIGVKTVAVKKIPLVKTIITAGRIDYDESRLTEINLRMGGWVERLYADRIGKYVRKGEPLFTIYSPQLVSAQEEFLITGKSRFADAGNGSARRKLLLLGVSESQIEELRQKGVPSTYMEIVSPVSGYVIFKSVLEGGHVKQGKTLFRIADISDVWLLADIYESDIPFIKVGQKAKISATSLPGKKLTGKITYLYPYLSPKTRSMKVRVELENSDEKLKPEMYANVQVKVYMGKRLVVPQSAVLDSGLRKIVFIRTRAGMFAPREIETGSSVGIYRPVLSGLKEGETVVSSAAFFLDSESKLMASMEGMMGLIGMGDWKMESAKMSEMDMEGMDMGKKGKGKMEMKGMKPSSGEKK